MSTALTQLIDTETSRQRQDWKASVAQTPPPLFSWTDWQEVLLSFTHHPEHEFMVRGAIAEIMQRSVSDPGYITLEHLLVVAISAHNKAWDFPSIPDEEDLMP